MPPMPDMPQDHRPNLSREAQEAQDELAAEAAYITATRDACLESARAATARFAAHTALLNITALALVVATLVGFAFAIKVLFL